MMPQDSYEQFKDASDTPIWDLFIGLSLLATIAGGGLGGIYAIGYFMTGNASAAWPLVGTVCALVAIDVTLRLGRARSRRR